MFCVLNTRPKKQAHHLSELIRSAGGDVVELPTIEIHPIHFENPNLRDFQHIIFQSSNAAHYFLQSMSTQHFPVSIAIGPATRKILQNSGIKKIIMPTHFSSRGILDLPILNKIRKQKILIVCGENPKSILLETLKNRGAEINMIFCYRRICPIYDAQIIFSIKNKINCVVSTSLDGFKNLLFIFRDHLAWLRCQPLCVVSDEMKQYAHANGFSSVIQSKNATDQAIVQAICFRVQ